MPCLEIKALISHSKLLEFSQSKMTFLHDLQQVEGFEMFTERQGKEYCINIFWMSRSSMDEFITSETYRFFHGALIALSREHSVSVNVSDAKKGQHSM